MEFKMKKVLCLVLSVFTAAHAFAQLRSSSESHSGEVSVLVKDTTTSDDSFYSLGKDGFLVHWKSDNSGERYQISSKQIKAAVLHPTKKEIAVYETDGSSINTISVWDVSKMSRKYSVNFEDSILSLCYSKKGTYLIAGTSTELGTIFINSSNGNLEKPITDSMNMMSFVETTDTEKSLMSYSLTGNICYYSFSDKKLKAKIPSTKGLNSPVVFSKYRYFAGINAGNIYIINAKTGKTILEHSAVKPYLLVINDDLYYYDATSSKAGTLYKFPVENDEIKKPVVFQNFKSSMRDLISDVSILSNSIVFGTSSGDVYKAEIAENETKEMTLLTTKNLQKINDVAIVDNRTYILTNKSLFEGMIDNPEVPELTSVTELIPVSNYTNLLCHEGSLIVWFKNTNNPVYSFDFTTKKLIKLFTPQGQLVSLKSCAGQLIEIESGTTVKKYNFDRKALQEVYYGSGVQDAVMLSSEDLYIAKTVTNSIDSPLIYVNTRTHETLPLKIDADYVYALSNDEVELSNKPDEKNIYALGIKHNSKNSSTVLLKYNATKKTTEVIYDFKKLNMHSFNIIYNQNVYNNVLDSTITSVNVKSKKITSYDRSNSLPVHVSNNFEYIYFINRDGSLSLLKPGSSSILKDYYITNEKELIN